MFRGSVSVPRSSSTARLGWLMIWLILTSLLPMSPASAIPAGAKGWNSGVAGYYPTAREACYAQWVWAGYVGSRSRFIGALDTDTWYIKHCLWTQFQYLCPQETPGQPGGCGTAWPANVYFDCQTGYTRMYGEICKPDPQVERPPTDCPAAEPGGENMSTPPTPTAGAWPNPSTGMPIILSTGSKLLSATDFVSSDGRFRIGRNYRSFLGGANTSLKQFPLGLAKGWQFNFEMELHLGAWSGSPASPTGNVTLLTPDGSAYDFTLDSSGAFVPRTASGWLSYDYKVEFVGTLPSNLATIYDSQTNWKVTGPDDRVWTIKTFSRYNANPQQYFFGRPTAITDRDGYAWTLTYATDGGLNSIVDTFGRTATFTWNYFYITFLTGITGSLPYPEAVDTVTFPDGTSAKYSYDPAPATTPPSTSSIQRLTGVTLRDAGLSVADSTTYHYENTDFDYAVTGITDHRNVRVATYQYDSMGRAVQEEGADGQNETTVAYGTDGALITRTVTNPLGRQTVYKFAKIGGSASNIRLVGVDGIASSNCPSSVASLSYGADGFVSQTADEENRITTYVRDSRARPTSITLADGRPEEQQISITWDTTYNVPAVIDRPGLTTTRTYNGSGRLTSLTETDTTTHTVPYSTNGQTRTWAYTYTTGGLVDTIDGPLPGTGDTVAYTYDAAGYVATYTDELGHVTTVNAVNGRGQPTEIEDPNGLITELAYDAVGRMISTVADPSGIAAETLIAYDDAGNVTRVTQPDGAYLDLVYDDNSRVESITDRLGNNVQFTYDAMGNVTQREAYNGFPALYFKWEQAFDELGRVIEVTGAGPASWAYGYDKVSNLTSVTDPNGYAASMAYDGLNRLIRFTDERASVTATTYGDTDRPATVTDPNTVVTAYVRNGWGEAIQEDSNDIGAVVYQRNQLGQVTERTDARGVVTEFAYDDAGRVTAATYPGETASNVAYSYDSTTGGNKGVDRLTGIDDAAGTVAYSYDLLGRTVREDRVIGAQTYTIEYGYDAAGNVTEITYPSGRTIFYDRDIAGQIDAVRNQPSGGSPVTLASSIAYTPFGPRAAITFANGTLDERQFDQDGRITALHLSVPATPTDLIDLSYAYGDKRNLTGISDGLDAAKNQTYAYTPNGFLTIAHGPWTGLTAKTDTYSLDSGSNRLAGIATGGTPSRSFDSDAAGNVVEDTDLSTSTATELAYNHPGQLASVEVGGTPKGSYAYDYLSRLVVRQLPATSTTLHLVHDLDGNVIAEYSGTGTLLREYVWLEDRPIAAITAGSPPTTYIVHTDHLERPVMMTDATAAVVWQASYLPFGEVASITGSATLDYRFPGQWFQLESGLAYNWHRHYDATSGRYMQPDPLGMPDGPARWVYVTNSPIMKTDPQGLADRVWAMKTGKISVVGVYDLGGGACVFVQGGQTILPPFLLNSSPLIQGGSLLNDNRK